jgi:RNA polymerase sigma-70 factor (ECF subfamily)
MANPRNPYMMSRQYTTETQPVSMSEAPDWNSYLQRVGKNQDKAAFAELFTQFSPKLKSFLLQAGSIDIEVAEELVQETMIKVWKKSPTFSPEFSSASTWIYTIARNTRIDWLRSQQRRDPQKLTAEMVYADSNTPSPFTNLLKVRQSHDIEHQIQTLPTEQKEVLKMMYLKGLSGQEIADALSLPLGTVKSRIRLALSKLKLRLAAHANINAADAEA